MKSARQRRGGLLCFAPACDASDDESAVGNTGSKKGGPERTKGRRRVIIISLFRFFRSDRSGRIADSSPDDKLAAKSCEKSSKVEVDRLPDAMLSPSLSSSSSMSSSSSSTLSLPSDSTAPERNLRRKNTRTLEESRNPVAAERSPTTGLCFVAVSLLVMVFCGRLSAILWTATWLICLVRRKKRSVGAPEVGDAAEGSPEIRSEGWEDYEKKRVVLEGLLTRSRRV